ncbi:uncharacterized protein LOC113389603 [Ctenocephalides felis]|uniref:uncharacterized protein LOC113389603 n=1 Tax=Ctenocephalides felis TaxID=7515 RepID=UPI000E6E1A85|nr:uncharacterized protein LOC113389603 [Ctenocephalides felis]
MIRQITKFLENVSASALKFQREFYKAKSKEFRMLLQQISRSRQGTIFKKQPALWCLVGCLVGGFSLATLSLARTVKNHPDVYLIRRHSGEERYWRRYTKLFDVNGSRKYCPAPDF